MVSVVRLQPDHLTGIDVQPSQRLTLGIDTRGVSREEAEELADEAEAWSIFADGRLIACFGIRETFPGKQGVAWATLAEGIGRAHLTMTRFAASRIAKSSLRRIEAIVRADDVEPVLSEFGELDAQQLIDVAMATPTPECVWARLVGLHPAHVLRKFGATGDTCMLFERLR
jgi:hypothetical protein